MTNPNDAGDGGKAPSQKKTNPTNPTTTTTTTAPLALRQLQQVAAAPAMARPWARVPYPPPPPPPPPALRPELAGIGGGGIRIGWGAGGGSASSVDVAAARPQKRKPVEINVPDGVKPICSVCNREFKTFKALFGHLRSHPDRGWRGCFPPPVLDNLQHHAAPAGGRPALNIDLNVRPAQPEREESSEKAEKTDIDLNKPPMADGDDGEN